MKCNFLLLGKQNLMICSNARKSVDHKREEYRFKTYESCKAQ